MKNMTNVIRTAEKDWLERAIKCYSKKNRFTIIDDGKLGITEKDLKSAVNLMRGAVKKTDETWKSIVGVLSGIGINVAGIYIIRLAITDPEPTTKLGLLIGGGLVLVLTGSLGILYSLGITFNISASYGSGKFEVKPV